MATLLWALVRLRWILKGVSLKFILALPVCSSENIFAAFHCSGSADASRPGRCFLIWLIHESFHSWKAAVFIASFCLLLTFSLPQVLVHSAISLFLVNACGVSLPFAGSFILLHVDHTVCWTGSLSDSPACWILLYFRYISIGRTDDSCSSILMLVELQAL